MSTKELYGWVKLHRSILMSPVWDNPKAARLFLWILLQPNHRRRVEYHNGQRRDLERGQVFATLPAMAAGTGLSAKEVRNALEYLRAHESIERRESVITLTNFAKYQGNGTDASLGEEGEERRGPAGDNQGQEKGQGRGQAEDGGKGRAESRNIPAPDKDIRQAAAEAGAGLPAVKRQAKGQDCGQSIHKVEEVIKKTAKKTDPPYPPFAKGGRFASSVLSTTADARLEQVLGMWQEAWTAAGQPRRLGAEGRRTRAGAEILARDWLGRARLNVAELRSGMAALIRKIRTDPNYGNYDLLTLANNPDKYCTAVALPAKAKRILWELTCDVCGHTVCTPALPEGQAPVTGTCGQGGCQGTFSAKAVKVFGGNSGDAWGTRGHHTN